MLFILVTCRRSEVNILYLSFISEYILSVHFFLWRCGPTRAMASSFLRFLDHTQRPITVGRTSLDESPVRCRDLYLTTHNIHYRQTSMSPVGFEPTISAGERPQTYALDRAATGILSVISEYNLPISEFVCKSKVSILKFHLRRYYFNSQVSYPKILWQICKVFLKGSLSLLQVLFAYSQQNAYLN